VNIGQRNSRRWHSKWLLISRQRVCYLLLDKRIVRVSLRETSIISYRMIALIYNGTWNNARLHIRRAMTPPWPVIIVFVWINAFMACVQRSLREYAGMLGPVGPSCRLAASTIWTRDKSRSLHATVRFEHSRERSGTRIKDHLTSSSRIGKDLRRETPRVSAGVFRFTFSALGINLRLTYCNTHFINLKKKRIVLTRIEFWMFFYYRKRERWN